MAINLYRVFQGDRIPTQDTEGQEMLMTISKLPPEGVGADGVSKTYPERWVIRLFEPDGTSKPSGLFACLDYNPCSTE